MMSRQRRDSRDNQPTRCPYLLSSRGRKRISIAPVLSWLGQAPCAGRALDETLEAHTVRGPRVKHRRLTHQLELADRPPGRDRLCGGDDAIRIDAVVPVEIGDGAGLAKMLDA